VEEGAKGDLKGLGLKKRSVASYTTIRPPSIYRKKVFDLHVPSWSFCEIDERANENKSVVYDPNPFQIIQFIVTDGQLGVIEHLE